MVTLFEAHDKLGNSSGSCSGSWGTGLDRKEEVHWNREKNGGKAGRQEGFDPASGSGAWSQLVAMGQNLKLHHGWASSTLKEICHVFHGLLTRWGCLLCRKRGWENQISWFPSVVSWVTTHSKAQNLWIQHTLCSCRFSWFKDSEVERWPWTTWQNLYNQESSCYRKAEGQNLRRVSDPSADAMLRWTLSEKKRKTKKVQT